jgi:hypothetical protein
MEFQSRVQAVSIMNALAETMGGSVNNPSQRIPADLMIAQMGGF